MEKKGLSAVVTTLIIILLAIVAIGVVWVVIKNVISEGAETISLTSFTLDLAIKSAYVDGSDIKVLVRRSAGEGDMTGIKFVFINNTDSVIIEKNIILTPSQEKSFTFSSTEISGIEAGDDVSVAPLYTTESGNERTGSITDTEEISGIEAEDEDEGGTGPPDTGECGDGTIQSPNGEEPPVNEICDGENLGGQGCTDLGYDGGDLTCDVNCQFVVSACTSESPSSCNGTWDYAAEDLGVECDGTILPDNCKVSCECEKGFGPDEIGGCDLDPAINNGTIFSVWNRIYLDSNDFPKSQVAVGAYQGSYINFTDSFEIACFRIEFADYVTETDISYLRLDDTFGFPNIAAKENYSIWEAENCGA